MTRRWMRTLYPWGVMVAGGAAALMGCAGKDTQELKPLSEERAESPSRPEKANSGIQNNTGIGEASASSTRPEGAEAQGAPEPSLTSFATGSPGWRTPSGGRASGEDVTFGPGTPLAAPQGAWAINTDSTGAYGPALGTGVTYGAATGTVKLIPQAPAAVPPTPPAPTTPLRTTLPTPQKKGG